MKLYKLTDENNKTHGDTKWGISVTHKAKGQQQGQQRLLI